MYTIYYNGERDTMQCLRPDCTREAQARGLCKVCYTVARRLVIDKQTTWNELEQVGKVSKKRLGATSWLLDKATE